MANEIYDSTWWGNTRQTASSIGTSTEMIQGQFNLTKKGDELVTNGDFATDSDWSKSSNWTISGGKAIADGSSQGALTQTLFTPIIGKEYLLSYEISDYLSGNIRVYYGGVFTNFATSNGIYNEIIKATSTASLFQTSIGSPFNGSIDNVSVKEVRATTVEAVKCLADTIHRIGLQDIQN
jgi:hypothetical protein